MTVKPKDLTNYKRRLDELEPDDAKKVEEWLESVQSAIEVYDKKITPHELAMQIWKNEYNSAAEAIWNDADAWPDYVPFVKKFIALAPGENLKTKGLTKFTLTRNDVYDAKERKAEEDRVNKGVNWWVKEVLLEIDEQRKRGAVESRLQSPRRGTRLSEEDQKLVDDFLEYFYKLKYTVQCPDENKVPSDCETYVRSALKRWNTKRDKGKKPVGWVEIPIPDRETPSPKRKQSKPKDSTGEGAKKKQQKQKPEEVENDSGISFEDPKEKRNRKARERRARLKAAKLSEERATAEHELQPPIKENFFPIVQ
jgi:hypothetical protein